MILFSIEILNLECSLLSFIKISFLILVAMLISSCGYIYGDDGLIKSKKFDYVNSKKSKDLKTPDDLTHKGQSNYAITPPIATKQKKYVVGQKLSHFAPTQLLAVMENTRVDRTSKQPAVLIVDKKETLWKTSVDFLEKHNFKNTTYNQKEGVITTDWIAIKEGGIWLGLDGLDDVELNRAKFKITISKGEIKDEHRLMAVRFDSQSRLDDDEPWSSQTVLWRDSADFLNLLLSHYDRQIRLQEAEHQSQVMAGFKVTLGTDAKGNPALLTNAKENLIWEKIPKVVIELGFKLIDKDVQQKIYFMEYEPIENGFFASLFDSSNSDFVLQEGAYQLNVAEKGAQYSITLKDQEGVGLDAELMVKLFPAFSRLFGDRR